jgi:hypothetical protein
VILQGSLTLRDALGNPVWTSVQVNARTVKYVQLLDNGLLVINDGQTEYQING